MTPPLQGSRPTFFAILLAGELLAVCARAQPAPAESPFPSGFKVACIGDSLTSGAGLGDRLHSSWPAILDRMTGTRVQVKNFGVSGRTLLKKGDLPIWREKAFHDALAFLPHAVFVFLGTNDSKLRNWRHKAEFEADLEDMVQRLRALPSHPRLLLCLPTPAWTRGRQIDGERIRLEVLGAIRQVALRRRCELVDLHTPLGSHRAWFPDGIHPNPFGAEFIAHRAFEALSNTLDESYDIRAHLGTLVKAAASKSFQGFRRIDFEVMGRKAILVQPHVAARGHPWVWRARFFGHEPQFDRAMLERGWHLAYVDVANLYGNAKALEIWNGFHQLLVERAKLSRKPVLEGMSRGGLIIFNWAKKHPDQVAGIYGDNPVLDPRSWPGGKGIGKGAPADWQRCLAAYGLSEAEALHFASFEIKGFEALARANVPLLHLIGMKDRVVPPAENTELLALEYRRFGGKIRVYRKAEAGHHPHSLPDPSLIVDFASRATHRSINFARISAPSVEFRGKSAGWGGGTWWDEFEKIHRLAAEHADLELVFLGDSVTQGLTGAKDRLARPGGKRLFDRFYGEYRAANFGISGDRTEHLLFRIQHGNFDRIHPAVIVLQIGVNNLGRRRNTGEEIAAGTRDLVAQLREKQPQAEILLLGCFPSGSDPKSWRRRQIDILHESIASLGTRKNVVYLDLRRTFLRPDGRIDEGKMRGDRIHLRGAGYEAWARAMAPTLREMRGVTLGRRK